MCLKNMKNQKIDTVQKHDKMLNKKVLAIAGVAYAGGKDMDKYLVSPINGPLDKLENVIIYTGTYDILNPDVHILEKLAKDKKLKLDIRETKSAAHIWLIKRYTDKKYDDDKAKFAYNDLVELINEK